MSRDDRLRQPAGTTSGGQFANDPNAASAAPVSLGGPPSAGSTNGGADAGSTVLRMAAEDAADTRELSRGVAEERAQRAHEAHDASAAQLRVLEDQMAARADTHPDEPYPEDARVLLAAAYTQSVQTGTWRNRTAAEAVALGGDIPMSHDEATSAWFTIEIANAKRRLDTGGYEGARFAQL